MTANCDICDERPGTHTIIVCQTETWICDSCCGRDDEEELDTADTSKGEQ
jgi:hypothetical protein